MRKAGLWKGGEEEKKEGGVSGLEETEGDEQGFVDACHEQGGQFAYLFF